MVTLVLQLRGRLSREGLERWLARVGCAVAPCSCPDRGSPRTREEAVRHALGPAGDAGCAWELVAYRSNKTVLVLRLASHELVQRLTDGTLGLETSAPKDKGDDETWVDKSLQAFERWCETIARRTAPAPAWSRLLDTRGAAKDDGATVGWTRPCSLDAIEAATQRLGGCTVDELLLATLAQVLHALVTKHSGRRVASLTTWVRFETDPRSKAAALEMVHLEPRPQLAQVVAACRRVADLAAADEQVPGCLASYRSLRPATERGQVAGLEVLRCFAADGSSPTLVNVAATVYCRRVIVSIVSRGALPESFDAPAAAVLFEQVLTQYVRADS